MADEIKFTDEELQSLKGLQAGHAQLQAMFGEVKIAQVNLANREAELTASFNQLKKQEMDLVKELNDKYGVGEVNPETGVFTPIENK